jgi:hypothetical protein
VQKGPHRYIKKSSVHLQTQAIRTASGEQGMAAQMSSLSSMQMAAVASTASSSYPTSPASPLSAAIHHHAIPALT